MNTRESLLSMIDTLPDEELDSLILFALTLSSKQRLDTSSVEGLELSQLACLRSRWSQFAEEWDSPEMEIYDV